MFVYTIPGDPVALARARFGNRRVWDSQKNIKVNTGIILQSQHGKQPLYTGPLHLDVIFYMPIASSHSAKKKEQLSDAYHFSKPDLDNLIKFILDTAHGIIFANDCIVSSLCAKKVYSLESKTEFYIRELNERKK